MFSAVGLTTIYKYFFCIMVYCNMYVDHLKWVRSKYVLFESHLMYK